jgi:hypothetical protein
LIEIYLLGCAIAFFFREEISDFFLAFLAILLGIFAYFINVFVMTICHIPLSGLLLSIVMGVEIILVILVQWIISHQFFSDFKWTHLWYLAAGAFFIGGSLFFLNSEHVFASPDSLYMIIMGQNLLKTGLSEWYFASPLQWGLFVPILQTIGLLFGYEFNWFIQPMISATFLVIFGYLVFKASRGLTSKKIIPYILTFLGIGLMISSNLYWIAQFYIHTNLDTGIVFFIIIASLYFAIREEKDSWLGIAAIFLILFGMIRNENIILAALVIILTIATQKIAYRKMLWTFLPYLIFQIFWNLIMIRINPMAYMDLMSVSQLRLVTVGLAALVLLVIISGQRWVWKKFIPLVNPLIVIGISVLLLGVFILRPENIFLDTWNNLQTMFVTGKWIATFWGVVALLLLVRAKRKDSLNQYFNILIFAFFSMIIILGFFKGNYHSLWYDSANRMYLHILPIMVFYLSIKISSNYSLSEEPELESDLQKIIGD